MTTESPEVRAAAEAACEFAETIPNYTALTMPACLAECWMHFQRLAKAWRSRTAPGPAWPKGATMMHDEAAVSAAIDETRKQPRDKALCRPCWYWTEKCHVLADACEHYRRELARLRDERGDDGEAVTEAWLRSVSAWQNDDDTFVFTIAQGVDRGEDGDDPWHQSLYVQMGCWWLGDGYDDSLTIEWNKPTRGHVRRLCQTLGITLDTAEGGGN